MFQIRGIGITFLSKSVRFHQGCIEQREGMQLSTLPHFLLNFENFEIASFHQAHVSFNTRDRPGSDCEVCLYRNVNKCYKSDNKKASTSRTAT